MFSQDCRVTVVQHSHDIRTSVAKISHCNSPKFRRDRFATLAGTSNDSRKTVARNSHASEILALVLFSRQIVARCSHVFLRLSRDRRMTLAQHSNECRENFALKIRQNFAATGSRHSNERRTTVARHYCEIFWRKNSHKILNMFKTFATISRPFRD